VTGALTREDEVDEILGAEGPLLAADRLHDWVWSVAAPIWPSGMYRHAVQTAGTNVDNMAKAKLHRTDISGYKLAGEAWSAAVPSPGRRRLRPVGFGTPDERRRPVGLAGARATTLCGRRSDVGGERSVQLESAGAWATQRTVRPVSDIGRSAVAGMPDTDRHH
jgi:hypothetical protein